jgi:hypothetical protein
MASKSKRAAAISSSDTFKRFKIWALLGFVFKVITSLNIQEYAVNVNDQAYLVNGIWIGADGENYLSGYFSLNKDGLFSAAEILNYWPAGYPILIFFLAVFGKTWVLTTLAIVQSLVFSYASYFFAVQLHKTRVRKYAFVVFLLLLINPTLSLSSLSIGYESLSASGFLMITALIIKDLIEKNNSRLLFLMIINSTILGFISFLQPRLLIAGLLMNLIWLIFRFKTKSFIFYFAVSLLISIVLPSTLVYRNYQAVGLSTISTNLGITMNIGAGDKANGGYMQKDYGVPCALSGSRADQDKQRVECVLKWYLSNPSKALNLFYKKTLYFWSPWFNNGFLGDVYIGTMARNPWLDISPVTSIASTTKEGANLVYGSFGKFISWMWMLGGLILIFYGYKILWKLKSLERLLGTVAMSAIGTNWLISLISIGDHRFRIPIMGLSLFLQAIGLKTILRGGKPAMVDDPALR